MRALNISLSILVSLLIGLFVLEGGLRLIGLGPPRNISRFDPHTGWAKQADAVQRKHTGEFDIEIRTNRFGLRDDPMDSPAKAPNSFRAVALGDSFTLGWSVDRADLFVDILERWWRAEDRRADVVNGGTEGWSTDQQVAWFLEEGRLFQPDLVLVFAYENDLYWCSETQYPPNIDKPRFESTGEREARSLVDHAGMTWTDDWALSRLLFGARPEKGRFTFQPDGARRPISKEWGAVLREQPEFMGEAEQRTLGSLRALARASAEIGARAVVVPIPSHSFVDEAYRERHSNKVLSGLPLESWSPEVPVETFLRLAQQAQLDTIDVRPALRAAAQAGDKLYFKQDWHFTPRGNEVFAAALKSELDAGEYFPVGHRPMTAPLAQMPPAPPHAVGGGVPFPVKLFGVLWIALTLLYILTYRDEPLWQPPLKVGALLLSVFTIFIGARWLIGLVPPQFGPVVMLGLVGFVLIFVAYKLGHRLGTILELMKSFTMRGHWYLMPLVVVLLTVGSLLVVAASSPLVAPFIYTLF